MASMMNENQIRLNPSSMTMTPMTLQQLNEKLERLRASANEPNKTLTKDTYLASISELQPLYSKLIIQDIESSIQRQLENYLWNDCFKMPLTKLQRSDKILFNFIIETGIGFYLGFIQDIGIHFDVPFIKNSLRTMYCTTPQMKQVVKCAPSKNAVYYVIQNSLVHMGDLLRYGGSYAEALKMYDKSTSLCPSNGHPYNQLGLVQLLIDNSIDCLFNGIYYYVRAVCTTNPFQLAQQNLDGLIPKVKNVKARNTVEEFLSSFLYCIEKLGDNQHSAISLTKLLSVLLSCQLINFQQMMRTLVVALWAWKREADQNMLGSDTNNEAQALEFIASLINGILDGAAGFGENDPYLFYCISLLNVTLEWIRLNFNVSCNIKFRSRLDTGCLCDFINRIAEWEDKYTEAVRGLDHVILTEEKKLLGFVPVSKAFEHLLSVMDDTHQLVNALRLTHFLKAAKALSIMEPHFITNLSGKYVEIPISYQPSIQTRRTPSRPNRRNVALQSIFDQFNSDQSTLVNAAEPVLSSISVQIPSISPQESLRNDREDFNGLLDKPAGYETPEFDNDNAGFDAVGFNQLFRSIWTPLQPESEDEVVPGNVWKF